MVRKFITTVLDLSRLSVIYIVVYGTNGGVRLFILLDIAYLGSSWHFFAGYGDSVVLRDH